MAANAVKVCTEFLKDEVTLSLKICGKPLRNGLCPERAEHFMKYKTGFCATGACEGTNPQSKSGKYRPTCTWWKRCPCECHLSYDKMFKMTETTRTLVNNSKWAPPRGEFWMPTLEERVAALAHSITTDTDAPVHIESPAPDVVPPTLVRSFTPTPTGRAGRGELESMVKRQCDIWLIDEEGAFNCTPKYLSDMIAKDEKIPAPSVGAIGAIFDRWQSLGFAETGRKPVRFINYTPDGIKLGLEGCKERAKRASKAKAIQQRRGVLR